MAWTSVAHSVRSQVAAGAAGGAGHLARASSAGIPAAIYRHALATGFSRGFEVAAGILLLALAVAVSVIRVRRDDTAGARPAATRP